MRPLRHPIVFDAGTDPLVQVRHIYSVLPDGSGLTQLTSGQHSDRDPSWSANYRRIVFTRNRHGGLHNVYSMNAKGQGVTRLTKNNLFEMSPVLSPDGTKIVFVRQMLDNQLSIITMNADGTNQAVFPFSGNNTDPTFSPDSKKILFTSDMHSTWGNYSESDRGGQHGIYKMDPDGSNVELARLAPVGSYIGYISVNAASTKMLYYSDEPGQQFRISGLNDGPATVIPLPKALASLASAAWSFAR